MDRTERTWRHDVTDWMSAEGDDFIDLGDWSGVEVTEDFFASSPLGLAFLDSGFRYRRVNEVLAAMNGVSAEAHFGRTPMELVPTFDSEQYLPELYAALNGEPTLPPLQINGETLAHPGETRWWETIFYPVRKDGQVRGVGVVAVDVSARKADEEALRREQDMARLILESAPNGMLLVDGNGSIVAVNPEVERLFGYDADELPGQSVEVLVPERFREAHSALRRRYFIEDPRPRPLGHGRDLYGRRKDGSEFPVEIGLGATPAVAGPVTVVVSDISERKRLEDERVRLIAAERAAADQLARLQRVSEAALAQLSAEELLPELLKRVAQAFDADTATVLLFNEERSHLTVAASYGVGVGVSLEESVPIGCGVSGSVARTGLPIVISDLQETDVYRQGLVDTGLRSLLAAPLIFDSSVIGVLHVGSRDVERFSDDDLGLLQPIADRVALAIDRARSFERERTIAETLQRSLLPEQLPELPGMSVAVRYFPGAKGTRVGGDWYDVVQRGNGDVLLVIGDVMGRGVRAASVMGQLRAALRVYAQLDLPLPEVVSRVNHTVLSLGDSEMATLLLVAVTPSTGEVQLVSAGHPPPVVRTPDGGASLLEGDNGEALGVTPDAAYHVLRTRLPPRAGLLLYTDGLIERPKVSMSSALVELARAVADAPVAPQEACDALVARFLPRGQQGDDVALLWMRLEPTHARIIDLTLDNQPEELARARAALRRWLPEAGANEAEVDDVVLAVCEALAAHPPQPDHPPRRLAVTLTGDRVEAVVRASHPATPSEETERGLGFVLLDALTDGFGVRREAGSTEVRIVRRLNGRRLGSPGDQALHERGLVVPAEPPSVPLCRRYVRERLSGAQPTLADNAELCVSELVTNAVLHADTDIEVRVERDQGRARIEVSDGSGVLPVRERHAEGSTTGRGLEVISRASQAWGVKPLETGGKTVWCDLTVEGCTDDPDIDQELAQWCEEGTEWVTEAPPLDSLTPAEVQTRGQVVLRRYPIDLGARARDHIESLVRECLLVDESAREVPFELGRLAETMRDYAYMLRGFEHQRLETLRQAPPFLDVVVSAVDAPSQSRRWQQALAELDDYAERGQLLTPPAAPDVAALHHWILNEILAQSRGRAARAWNAAT